jgi:CRP-like cAMP-binding protein
MGMAMKRKADRVFPSDERMGQCGKILPVVYRAGEEASHFYRVTGGRVMLTATKRDGKIVCLGVVLPGGYFGFQSLRPEPGKFRETAHVLDQGAEITELDAAGIRESSTVANLAIGALLESQDFIGIVSSQVLVSQKLTGLLIFLAQSGSQEGNRILMPPLTHYVLAVILGTTREVVSVAMKKLARKKLLGYDRKGIWLFMEGLDKLGIIAGNRE